MANDKKRAFFGDLNNLKRPVTRRHRNNLEGSENSFLDRAREATNETLYNYSITEGVTTYYGVVVDVVDGRTLDGNPVDRFLDNIGKDKNTRVRVRIPELHASLRDPADEPKNFVATARQYPIFSGETDGQPEVGRIVKVKIQDPKSGIYGFLEEITDKSISLEGALDYAKDVLRNTEYDLKSGSPLGDLTSQKLDENGLYPVPKGASPRGGGIDNDSLVDVVTGPFPEEIRDSLDRLQDIYTRFKRFWQLEMSGVSFKQKGYEASFQDDVDGSHGKGTALDIAVYVNGSQVSSERVFASLKAAIDGDIIPSGEIIFDARDPLSMVHYSYEGSGDHVITEVGGKTFSTDGVEGDIITRSILRGIDNQSWNLVYDNGWQSVPGIPTVKTYSKRAGNFNIEGFETQDPSSSSIIKPIHPVPAVSGDGMPNLYGKKSPRSTIMTSDSLLGSCIRTVGGFSGRGATWSRPFNSYHGLDVCSIGFAHFWSGKIGNLLRDLLSSEEGRALAVRAWGEDAILRISKNGFDSIVKPEKGKVETLKNRDKNPRDPLKEMQWFAAGFQFISFDPLWLEIYISKWMKDYLAGSINHFKSNSFKKTRSLLAILRMANSAPNSVGGWLSKSISAVGRGSEDEIIDYCFTEVYKSYKTVREDGQPDKVVKIDRGKNRLDRIDSFNDFDSIVSLEELKNISPKDLIY